MDVLEFVVPASLNELDSATEGLTASKERPDVASLSAAEAEALVESAREMCRSAQGAAH